MKQYGMDIVRVTEAAAIQASAWVGSGNKELADQAATDAMRERLNKLNFSANIAIGEGKKDESYGLFTDENVGANKGGEIECDIAVDPIEGTRPTVTSGPEAISVMAIAEYGAMYKSEEFYCNKLVYGPKIKEKIDLKVSSSIEHIALASALSLNKDIKKLVVCILDRERHTPIIEKLRELGVRIKLIQDCDVSGAIATCLPESEVDLLYGIGGLPEAVISACAIKCFGGGMTVQIARKQTDNNFDIDDKILETNDLVKGECIFAATGITDGSILKGVRFTKKGPLTNSVYMRSESGTIRWMKTYHGN